MKGRDFPVSRWPAGLGRFFSLAWVTQKSFPSCNLSAVLILLIDYLPLIPESWSVPFGASTPFAPLPQLRVVVGPPPLRLPWSIWKPPYLQVAAETPFSHPGEVAEPRCCLATGFCREERIWFGFLLVSLKPLTEVQLSVGLLLIIIRFLSVIQFNFI